MHELCMCANMPVHNWLNTIKNTTIYKLHEFLHAYNKDEDIRMDSTSGDTFNVGFKYIQKQGYVGALFIIATIPYRKL